MSSAAPTQPDTQPSRSGRLLALIRKLIDYGRELAVTVRQRVAADPVFARTSFGTADLAVIVARIARGLRLAQALEARVLSHAAALDKGPKPSRTPRTSRPQSSASPPAKDADTPLALLPTPEQIEDAVRRRPITAVIADIYRDLGIVPSHPLWRDLQQVMFEFGGNLTRLLCDMFNRVAPFPPRYGFDGRTAASGPASHPDGPDCTGPP